MSSYRKFRLIFLMKQLPAFAFALASVMLLAADPAAAADSLTEVVHLDFDSDAPGEPPLTGGPGQPTSLVSQVGTSILVQPSANGIDTQPVVLTAQGPSQFAGVITLFDPVAEGTVRVEAVVAFDRLADGFFLQTTAGSGSFPLAIVTRLITTDSGEIQNNATRTPVGTYAPNQPFRVRMDIDMSANSWSVVIDNEMNGFDDNPLVSNLPFENPLFALPTVGQVWAALSLFPTLSVAPTAVAYDDIRVLVPAVTVEVDIDIKPGSFPNSINLGSAGVVPVAILGSPTFDATTVDPASVRLAGAGVKLIGKGDKYSCSVQDVNGDGLVDLVCHVVTAQFLIAPGDTIAVLEAKTFSGQAIRGEDSIRIVPR